MNTTLVSLPVSHVARIGCLMLAVGLVAPITGCGKSDSAANAPAERPVFTVRIDRDNNGAATESTASAQEHGVIPRTLAFEMAGMGRATGSDVSAGRVAASQAAIIEALGRAMVEARRARGRSTENFDAELSRRLKISHRMTDGGPEFTLTLIARGNETRFIVRDGLLQHAPHDLELVRKIFDETNGEYALLGTEPLAEDNLVVATVACYRPAAMETAVASDGPVEEGQTP